MFGHHWSFMTRYDRKIAAAPASKPPCKRPSKPPGRPKTAPVQRAPPASSPPSKSPQPQAAQPQAPSKSPDEFLLKQIRSCLQTLSREDRFQIIRKDFSQLQRLLFEEWMRSPASEDPKQDQKGGLKEQKHGAGAAKRKKMSSAPDQRPVGHELIELCEWLILAVSPQKYVDFGVIWGNQHFWTVRISRWRDCIMVSPDRLDIRHS